MKDDNTRRFVIPKEELSLWKDYSRLTVEMYNTRRPNGNDQWFMNLSIGEQEGYLVLLSKYVDMLYQWFIEKYKLKEYDDVLFSSEKKFKRIDVENMDLYQYLGSKYLRFYYIRNNVYIERLRPDEMEYLMGRLQCADSTIDDRDREFLEKTYARVLPEKNSEDISEHVRIAYGSNESLDFFKPDNAIVIGVRYDEYYVENKDDEKRFDSIYNSRLFEVDTMSWLFEKNGEEWSKDCGLPFCMIHYNGFTVKSIRNFMKEGNLPIAKYYYFRSSSTIVMNKGTCWYHRDITAHKWVEDAKWSKIYEGEKRPNIVEIEYDEEKEIITTRRGKDGNWIHISDELPYLNDATSLLLKMQNLALDLVNLHSRIAPLINEACKLFGDKKTDILNLRKEVDEMESSLQKQLPDHLLKVCDILRELSRFER